MQPQGCREAATTLQALPFSSFQFPNGSVTFILSFIFGFLSSCCKITSQNYKGRSDDMSGTFPVSWGAGTCADRNALRLPSCVSSRLEVLSSSVNPATVSLLNACVGGIVIQMRGDARKVPSVRESAIGDRNVTLETR